MEYGDKIKVIKGVSDPASLVPAVGVEGKFFSKRANGMLVCEFQPPFPLHGGGTALADPNHPEGVRIFFNRDEIEAI